jgi:hypothetical protein
MPASPPQPAPPTPRRHNALAEFERPAAPPVNARLTARTFFAVVMLAVGLGVALWLVYVIHAAITRADNLGILQRFGQATAEQSTVVLPSGKVTLPPVLITAAAYLFMVLLLAIGAKIGITLIKEGSWMLRWESPSDAGTANNPKDDGHGTAA